MKPQCHLFPPYKQLQTENLNQQLTKTDRVLFNLAMRTGSLKLYKFAVSKHVEKNPVDADGYTVLHKAAGRGNTKICEYIMDQIKDKNPSTEYGLTPLDLAEGYPNLQWLICEKNRMSHPKYSDALYQMKPLTEEVKDALNNFLILKKKLSIQQNSVGMCNMLSTEAVLQVVIFHKN